MLHFVSREWAKFFSPNMDIGHMTQTELTNTVMIGIQTQLETVQQQFL